MMWLSQTCKDIRAFDFGPAMSSVESPASDLSSPSVKRDCDTSPDYSDMDVFSHEHVIQLVLLLAFSFRATFHLMSACYCLVITLSGVTRC